MEGDEPATASAINGKVWRQALDENAQKSLLASGSALGAIAMSSCCILPVALFSLGVTGAWIGNLAALYPYKAYFFVATAGFLATGFWKVYRKPKAAECAEGSYCASPASDRVVKTALWASTILVAAALAFPYAAPLFLDY
jgi:mercuric ion transport protein